MRIAFRSCLAAIVLVLAGACSSGDRADPTPSATPPPLPTEQEMAGRGPYGVGVITIDLSFSFIGAGKGKLFVDARVLKPGRNTVFTEGEVTNEDGSLVAKAIGTVRVRVAEK